MALDPPPPRSPPTGGDAPAAPPNPPPVQPSLDPASPPTDPQSQVRDPLPQGVLEAPTSKLEGSPAVLHGAVAISPQLLQGGSQPVLTLGEDITGLQQPVPESRLSILSDLARDLESMLQGESAGNLKTLASPLEPSR